MVSWSSGWNSPGFLRAYRFGGGILESTTGSTGILSDGAGRIVHFGGLFDRVLMRAFHRDSPRWSRLNGSLRWSVLLISDESVPPTKWLERISRLARGASFGRFRRFCFGGRDSEYFGSILRGDLIVSRKGWC